jgi:hypothetical protein
MEKSIIFHPHSPFLPSVPLVLSFLVLDVIHHHKFGIKTIYELQMRLMDTPGY